MSRFIFSCGGTGGHLSPGIALAEALAERGHEPLLLISEKEVDGRLIEKYPALKFQRMPGTGFGWRPWVLARCIGSQSRAFLFCLKLVRGKSADAVVGFGGFTSAPLVAAARAAGVPAVLHEANRVPGLAVRTLGRFARRVYLPAGVDLAGLRRSVIRHVGLPVRREIQRVPAGEARRTLGLDPHQRVLAVLGGSQGSSPLNDWTRANLEAFAAGGIQVYCVTGLGKDREKERVLRSRAGAPVRAMFEAFSDRMALVLSAADLVVSRAGAGTLAELVRCETPAVLVPYPQAADDHQRANAEFFARQGGGVVVAQSRLSDLLGRVLALMADEKLLCECRGRMRRMDRANAVELIVRDLEEIAQAGDTTRRATSAMPA